MRIKKRLNQNKNNWLNLLMFVKMPEMQNIES